jgi:hypothetical protein
MHRETSGYSFDVGAARCFVSSHMVSIISGLYWYMVDLRLPGHLTNVYGTRSA